VHERDLIHVISVLRTNARRQATGLFESAPHVIAQAARRVLDDNTNLYRLFLEAGPKVGYSVEMVREALVNSLGSLKPEALKQLQQHSLGAAASFHRPELIFHVLSGNLFVSGIESINTAMLTGGASLVRCSSADQLFPALWRQAISEVSPEWGSALHTTYWPTTEESLTSAACCNSDVVVAFGSDESVAAVRAHTPIRVRFIPHGTRISFAIVPAEALRRDAADVARKLAYDFSVYDQQGCLSPRAAFLECAQVSSLKEFQATFVDEMRLLAAQLPPGGRDLSVEASLARERNEVLIEFALGSEAELWSESSDRFVVSMRGAEGYTAGSLNRFADLRVVTSIAEVESALGPYRGQISTLGVAGNFEGLPGLAHKLQPDRVCKIGEMQKPPLGWTHDGRQPLSELVQFTSLEL
jgi:hypothetical protein